MRNAAAVGMLLLAATPASAEPDAARQKELLYLLKHDCGSCHGMTLKGGLGAPLLPEILAQRRDDELLASILDGMPGTAMPPWRPLLSPDEALFLVGALRRGGLE
ncbi:MAG: cytochrome c [Magnetospirillum sp. WYHS-4]